MLQNLVVRKVLGGILVGLVIFWLNPNLPKMRPFGVARLIKSLVAVVGGTSAGAPQWAALRAIDANLTLGSLYMLHHQRTFATSSAATMVAAAHSVMPKKATIS